MKCHYEVLEISRDADDSQIKTAYRKLALKWHPDKNLDNSDDAKEQFQLVQQAYEILSDRQERAWYDNHREQILRGSNSEFEDKSLDVYQYFTTTCFKGYNDNEDGFYTVYRRVFEEITHEDIEYMEDKEELHEVPLFGTSTSDYDEVVGPFYAYWMSYSTKKSYVWLDPYNINETRDRRIFKLVEKENKKIRQKAKKERNEEVRALVAFVRKRDKRVHEHSKRLEAKIAENRQKQEELSKQKRLERKKQLNESKSEAEWAKFDNVKMELEQIERNLAEEFGEQFSDDEDVDSNSELEMDNLYCVACNKVFKTPKTFQNHESSKKHRENVEKIKDSMLDEEDTTETLSNEEIIINDDNGENFSNEEGSNEELEDEETKKQQRKKQKKSKNVFKVNLVNNESLEGFDEGEHHINVVDSDTDFDSSLSKKQKRKNKKSSKKNDKIVDKNINDALMENVGGTENGENQENVENDSKKEKVKKSKKAKDKRGKKETDFTTSEVDANHCCVRCKADFPSKNKLFDHLKKTGHSVYLPQDKIVKSKKPVHEK